MSLSLIIKLALLAVIVLILAAGLLIVLVQRFRRQAGQFSEAATEALLPAAIHLEPLRHVEWISPRAVTRNVRGLRSLGFRVISTFRAAEVADVRMVALGHPQDGLGAVVCEWPVGERARSGVFCDVVARYMNGGKLTVSTWPGHRLTTRPGHEKIVLKRATPKKLCEILFKNLVSQDLLSIHPKNFVRFYETAYAEDASWRHELAGPREAILRDPELDALSEPLFQRLKARDQAGVKDFLDLGFSPEGRDPSGRTPLMVAVTTGELSLVETLLTGGADPNARSPGIPGLPPFDPLDDTATGSGDRRILKAFDKAFGKAKGAGGESEALVTPLTLAIETGVPEIVTALLNAGANLEGPGDPPLHFAAGEGDLDMVRAIVEAGADVHQVDGDGMTPLHHAAIEGHAEVMEYLVSSGADVNARFGKETAITLAAESGATEVVELLELYVKRKQIKRARKLLEEAAPFGNVRARRLLNAAACGHAPMVRKLLAAGVPPDAREHEDGEEMVTALMLAAQGGHVETMRALIEAGADVHREDDRGEKVISRALRADLMESEDDQGEALRLLVRYGADLSGLDSEERALVDSFVNE